MTGLDRVNELGRRAGRRERSRDLPGDVTALPDASHDDSAPHGGAGIDGRLKRAVKRIRKSLKTGDFGANDAPGHREISTVG